MKTEIIVNQVALNISTTCQRKCKRCYGHLSYDSKEVFMNLETAKRSLELFFSQLPAEGGDFMFFGGEPLLNWDLIEKFVPYYYEMKLPFEKRLLTITNGLALTKERIKFLSDFSVLPITISLDGDYETHNETRGISREEHSHLVEMIKYGLTFHPHQMIPFCVIKKNMIPKTYAILSYISELGVNTINIYRDISEEWTNEEREQFTEMANQIIKKYQVIIQPFTESIFDCRSCYAPSIMIYPNGDIVDACYTMGSILRDKGLVSEKQLKEVMYMGNVFTTDKFMIDIEAKKAMIREHMDCHLVHENIYKSNKLLYKNTNVAAPSYRVMEVCYKNEKKTIWEKGGFWKK